MYVAVVVAVVFGVGAVVVVELVLLWASLVLYLKLLLFNSIKVTEVLLSKVLLTGGTTVLEQAASFISSHPCCKKE